MPNRRKHGVRQKCFKKYAKGVDNIWVYVYIITCALKKSDAHKNMR